MKERIFYAFLSYFWIYKYVLGQIFGDSLENQFLIFLIVKSFLERSGRGA